MNSDSHLRRAGSTQNGLTPFPFIVGRGRSGTTLLRMMLTSHPEMAIPPESHFIVPLDLRRRFYEREEGFDTERYLSYIFQHYRFGAWGLDHEAVRRYVATETPRGLAEAIRCLYRLYAAARGKQRYGDKTPIHVIHIERLSRLFPDARFIHIYRDGRDVALSYLSKSFGPNTVEEAAVYWDRFVRAGRRAGEQLGQKRYIEVCYEDLVTDPEPQLRRIARYLDLPYRDEMTRYHESPDLPPLEYHPNVHGPLIRSVRDWRQEMTGEQAERFDVLAGALLSELGYERVRARPTIRRAWWYVEGQAFVQSRRLKRKVLSRSGWDATPAMKTASAREARRRSSA